MVYLASIPWAADKVERRLIASLVPYSGIPLLWSANGSTTYRYDYYLIIYQYNFTSRQYQLYYQGYQPSGVTLPRGLHGYFAWQVAVDHTYGDITGHYSGSPFSYFTAQ